MNNETKSRPKISWAESNQAYLVAEFARLKKILGDGEEPYLRLAKKAKQPQKEDAPAVPEAPPAIEWLCELFGFSTFERDVLLLCAGVEMDSELAALCSGGRGRSQQSLVTFGLAMAKLSEPHWSALTTARPLRRYRLVEVESGHGLASAPLRIDERVLHYLAGVNLPDARLQALLQASRLPDWIADNQRAAQARTARFIEEHGDNSPVLHLCGDDSHGQEDIASLAAQEAGRLLYVLRAEDVPAGGAELDQLAVLWEREALLLPGVLLVQCGSAGLTASARNLVERLQGPLLVASRDPLRLNRSWLRLDVDKPRAAEQKQLWERALGSTAATLNGLLDDLSQQFRLSTRMIFSTGAAFASPVSEAAPVRPADIWNACRSLARPHLESLAQRLIPCAGWDDLVLPDLQKQTLRQLASQVRHRMKVYETWGFAAKTRRGLGVGALFAGESGTGKTLAAEVLACELGLDLYRIDLSAVVSKYIGETEKNLKRVFDAAEEGGAILLFDEADALFGKRTEVRDSHDRYANIEVSYLLQRIEEYLGLAILTTNLRSSLDGAFLRRLRFIVTFAFPDVQQREAIWKNVFPTATPTQGLIPAKLAQLNVTGGNIRNIALNAAFLAAAAGQPVQMSHLLQAARVETQKIERPLSDAEIRGWV
jgi:SpoVK/Ycf46/Vps4 family AAA+-type ATPase